jgi:hypothetical protein
MIASMGSRVNTARPSQTYSNDDVDVGEDNEEGTEDEEKGPRD